MCENTLRTPPSSFLYVPIFNFQFPGPLADKRAHAHVWAAVYRGVQLAKDHGIVLSLSPRIKMVGFKIFDKNPIPSVLNLSLSVHVYCIYRDK